MSIVHVLPDVETLVVQLLKEKLTTLDGRVSGGTLNPRTEFPACRVTVISDTVPIDWRLTGTWVQVDIFGGTREEARTLCRQAHAELVAWNGVYHGAVISNVRTINGVRPLPNQPEDQARYVCDLRISAHPIP